MRVFNTGDVVQYSGPRGRHRGVISKMHVTGSATVATVIYTVLLDGETEPVVTDGSSLTLVREHDNDANSG